MGRRKNVIAVATLSLAVFGLVGCGSEPALQDKPSQDDVMSTSAEGVDDPNAVFVAANYLGLPEKAPPTYWYADTSSKTAPAKSFGLYSSTANQRIMFVVFDDMNPVDNLGFFTKKPPYVSCRPPSDDNILQSGNTNLGKKNLKWSLVKLKKPQDAFKAPGLGESVETVASKNFNVLIGAVPTRKKGKSMLMIARGYSDDHKYSHDETLLRLEAAFKKDLDSEAVPHSNLIGKPGDDDDDHEHDDDDPKGEASKAGDSSKAGEASRGQAAKGGGHSSPAGGDDDDADSMDSSDADGDGDGDGDGGDGGE